MIKPKPDDWKCVICDGIGMVDPFCETCSGNGWVDDEEDGGTMTCPDCGDEKCSACGGSGEQSRPNAPAMPRGEP